MSPKLILSFIIKQLFGRRTLGYLFMVLMGVAGGIYGMSVGEVQAVICNGDYQEAK